MRLHLPGHTTGPHFDSRDRHSLRSLPPGPRAAVRRMEHAIKHTAKLPLIYDFGGGRVNGRIIAPPSSGTWTDCSGYDCWLAAVLGVTLKNPAGNTTSFLEEGEKGRGKYVTFLIKEIPGQPDESHMFVEVRGRYAECGGFDNPDPGGGPSWFHPSAARLDEFPHHRHFKGL